VTFTGTPLPKDEPTTVNPPFGARIDYVLAQAPKQPVRLTIRDAQGRVVRSYASTDMPPKWDPAHAAIAAEWNATPSTLAATPGLHRFIWPLRYPPLAPPDGGGAYADGVKAAPGRYSVELVVDGQAFTQPLTVVPDPRVRLPAGAFARQFAFARDVEALQVRLDAAQAEAKRLHAALGTAVKGADQSLLDAIRAVDAKVVALAGIVESPNPNNAWAMQPRAARTFSFVSSAIGKLADTTEGADVDPSPDARAGYAATRPMLEAVLVDWTKLKSADLAALNARLRLAGKAEVSGAAKK
jgi:hypothetical protein